MKRVLLAVVVLALSWDAGAETIECNDRIITRGDSIAKVATFC